MLFNRTNKEMYKYIASFMGGTPDRNITTPPYQPIPSFCYLCKGELLDVIKLIH